VAGAEPDPNGSKALGVFLEGFRRITIEDACRRGPIDLVNVTVWTKHSGPWQQRPASTLKKGKPSQSVCRSLVTGLYGWSDAQYEALRDVFDDEESADLMGIYTNDQGQYAVVGRLPVHDRWVQGGIGAAGLATGVLGKWAVDRLKPSKQKWIEAHQKLLGLYKQLHWFDARLATMKKCTFDFAVEHNVSALNAWNEFELKERLDKGYKVVNALDQSLACDADGLELLLSSGEEMAMMREQLINKHKLNKKKIKCLDNLINTTKSLTVPERAQFEKIVKDIIKTTKNIQSNSGWYPKQELQTQDDQEQSSSGDEY
jgi:hypothetical protein